MNKVFFCLILAVFLAVPVSAELTVPEVPEAGAKLMPEETRDFGQALGEILKDLLPILTPHFYAALVTGGSLAAACLLVSLVPGEGGRTANLGGVVAASALLLGSTGAMIRLGEQTVTDISEYQKLLLPAMTAALAAQGGATAAAALYAGSAAFNTLLSRLMVKLLIPVQYLFLAASMAGNVLKSDFLKNLKDTMKGMLLWCLKTILSLFTAYLGITGVVAGSADAAAVKAAKAAFGTLVPVVGSVLAEASEAVLVGAGVLRGAMGVYGILAILAVFLEPFGRIGIQYLILKATAAFCGLFAPKAVTTVIADFSEVMRMLLGMTGAICVLGLVSTVCFLKGVS